MLSIKYYDKYRKQFVKLTRKNKPRYKTITYIESLLIAEKPIPSEYNDHPLSGNLSGYYDLHIEPNLILVYTIINRTVGLVALINHDELNRLNLPAPTDLIDTMSSKFSIIGAIAKLLRSKKWL